MSILDQLYLQQFYLYLNLTKPKEQLCLSYSQSNGRGEASSPAFLLHTIKRMFPKLSKTSSVVSTDVTDTIEWALPSLMKVFTGGNDVISISGVDAQDDHNAEMMPDLISFQLQIQNHFFPILYNWMKDALMTGLGVVKCYWDREEGYEPVQCVLNFQSLQALINTGVKVESISAPDKYGDYTVVYDSTFDL